MANNWPDGGEQPLSAGEKLAMGAVGVVLIGGMVAGLLILALLFIGPRPSLAMVIGCCVVGLAVGLLWIRPWETEPQKSRRVR